MNDIYKIKDAWLKDAKVNKEEYEKMTGKTLDIDVEDIEKDKQDH